MRLSITILLCLCVAATATARASTRAAAASFPKFFSFAGAPYNVSYNERALLLDGNPSLFISGSLHMPRLTPGDWSRAFQTLVDGGANMVQVYVFWNFHQPTASVSCWDGPCNLTAFIALAGQFNLFVTLRIGPYVCAEWDYGGIPEWVGATEGMRFRTYNPQWVDAMSTWMEEVVARMDAAQLFARQGGPIVLAQIENELPEPDTPDDIKYVQWCGLLASQLGTGTPWVMCNGASAPSTINTCNGFECVTFLSTHGQSGQILVSQPALWTEDEGGFQVWGESPTSASQYPWGVPWAAGAYEAARWFARGGSHYNFYMWTGGNNFGNFAGAAVTTAYATDAPVCPTLVPHEPRFSHAAALHAVLADYAESIVGWPAQLSSGITLPIWDNATSNWTTHDSMALAFVCGAPGPAQLVFVESSSPDYTLVSCNQMSLDMAPASILLLSGAGDVLWASNALVVPPANHTAVSATASSESWVWYTWTEPQTPDGVAGLPSVGTRAPLEQNTATLDIDTQYLFYTTNFTVSDALASAALRWMGQMGSVYQIRLDGQFVSEAINVEHNNEGTVNYNVHLGAVAAGSHHLSILSISLGNNNLMAPDSRAKLKGITGTVRLWDGLAETDLTDGGWSNRPSLAGEVLGAWNGTDELPWEPLVPEQLYPTPTWYRTAFATPSYLPDGGGWLLDATGLGRGHMWLNGNGLGRYWNMVRNDGSGLATQRYYYLPADWLAPPGELNVLALAETLLPSVKLSTVGLAYQSLQPGAPDVSGNVVSDCGL